MQNAIIVVLGCSLEVKTAKGEKYYLPTAVLKNRLDKTLDVFDEMRKSYNTFILVSGRGRDEASEAEVMKKYLMVNGIGSSTIVMENRSMNTLENCTESFIEIYHRFFDGDNIGVDGYTESRPRIGDKLVIVTSDFHIPRTRRIFEYFGSEKIFDISFVGSETPESERSIRETRERITNIEARLKIYPEEQILNLFKDLLREVKDVEHS